MLEETRMYTFYRWDCPYCGGVNDMEDNEAGELECCDCGEIANVLSE